ncbi:MAG TPA: thioredoxin domain-containing protein, partial [Clostridia bacterium]|nr:thioredoxin domain-containing protein [Clostridia bacterium]
LQHAHNPVNWYPWGNEAFDRAVSEDKPIFLSIGYSTCHWCHVMEHESFEDEEVAQILNENFISIKVDREERPDIDHIYMTVCQMFTGHGGWPLTVFLTPDRKPFYVGTYYPKEDRGRIPGIMTILDKVFYAWKNKREAILETGDQISDSLGVFTSPLEEAPPDNTVHEAYLEFKNSFDNKYGGFGRAPKFPSPHNLYFLLRYWYITKEKHALEMVEKNLDSMYKGGIYDHIGFGFCRYSTDEKWLVPHFEKMLYDNALLSIAYLEAYQATQKNRYSEAAEQIFTYILRDMTSPEGGFYSAEDADSEGIEGKFYVWTPEEIKKVLGGKDGEKYCKHYDITPEGNFEGTNIPNLIENDLNVKEKEFFGHCREKLFNYRNERIHPYKDDKILTSWNGLMIAALAIGSRITGKTSYAVAAEKALSFILSKLVRSDGRLLARYRDGESAIPGYTDDYSFLIWGMIELYETTYKPEYLQKALKLNDDLIKYFWDEHHGGLFMYGSDSEQLIARPKEIYDGAMPSGNSVACLNFLRLARLTGNHELEARAYQQFKIFGKSAQHIPMSHAFFLTAFMFSLSKSREVVLVGEMNLQNSGDMLQILRNKFMPFTVSMHYSDEHRDLEEIAPFIEGYKEVDEKMTAYVCQDYACQAPVNDAGKFSEMLR